MKLFRVVTALVLAVLLTVSAAQASYALPFAAVWFQQPGPNASWLFGAPQTYETFVAATPAGAADYGTTTVSPVPVPVSGLLTHVAVNVRVNTANGQHLASGEPVAVYIRVNNTTDVFVTDVSFDQESHTFVGVVGYDVVAGDDLLVKVATPTWATPADMVWMSVTAFIN